MWNIVFPRDSIIAASASRFSSSNRKKYQSYLCKSSSVAFIFFNAYRKDFFTFRDPRTYDRLTQHFSQIITWLERAIMSDKWPICHDANWDLFYAPLKSFPASFRTACTAWWISQSYRYQCFSAQASRGDQRKELTTRLMRWTFSDCWLLFLLILLNADFWERLREKLVVRIKTFPIPLHSARECLWFIYGFISFILWLQYNAFRLPTRLVALAHTKSCTFILHSTRSRWQFIHYLGNKEKLGNTRDKTH